jgi:hypothetical protein
MSKGTQPKRVSTSEFESFLSCETTSGRLQILNDWKSSKKGLDDNLVRALMTVPVSRPEIIAALEICATEHKADFELWVMNHLLAWEQNVAAVAIRAWARVTDKILWHRLIPVAMMPGLPQRVRYTILDIAPSTHGYELTLATLESNEWEDLSPAFHALMFERALEYDLKNQKLDKIAWNLLNDNKMSPHPENKALLPAIAWLTRHQENALEKWVDEAGSPVWIEMIRSCLHRHASRQAQMSRLAKACAKDKISIGDLQGKLPAVWSRYESDPNALMGLIRLDSPQPEWISGFNRDQVRESLKNLTPDSLWTGALILALPFSKDVKAGLSTDLSRSYDSEKFPKLAEARATARDRKLALTNDQVRVATDFIDNPGQRGDSTPTTHNISAFYQTITGNKSPPSSGTIWDKIALAWLNPENCDLNQLSAEARKYKGVVTLTHIKSLGRFQGRDEAVLKLLDYIRSDEETELRAVVRALGEINSQRSLLELISMLTRPNATIPVQQDIVAILNGKDLKALQKELRSAVHDLVLPVNTDHPVYQIKDELTAMLAPGADSGKIEPSRMGQGGVVNVDDTNLDKELGSMIPHFRDLSSEVKRALRTALFFHKTVEKSAHINEIDLSPLIDMQYKAMELLYREFFEDVVSQSLQKGSIQRKLDVIGYARPIVRQMDEFEAYIASLPVVREIPFFSKFKLRKMLRAICQFEPGRRFTLDGLKAFGLYFLIFGRQSCKYSLNDSFQSGAKNDAELAELCRELHVFQDFRNRAAHEGFHPDASNDVMGIWRTTAVVVQWAFKIKNAQKINTTAMVNGKAVS